MSLTDEEWRFVPGYEGLYEVSNLGRVKSTRRGSLLAPEKTRAGHLRVTFSKDSIQKRFLVHRLVAMVFIPNPLNLPLVLHGENGVLDNSAGNLRWGTNSDNMRDRVRDGTCLNSRKTHCPRGHEYTPDNIKWHTRKNRSPSRECRTCDIERQRARRRGRRRHPRPEVQALMKAGASLNEIRRVTGADYRTIRRIDPTYRPFEVGGGGDAAVIRETNRQLQEFLRRGKISRNRENGFKPKGS